MAFVKRDQEIQTLSAAGMRREHRQAE